MERAGIRFAARHVRQLHKRDGGDKQIMIARSRNFTSDPLAVIDGVYGGTGAVPLRIGYGPFAPRVHVVSDAETAVTVLQSGKIFDKSPLTNIPMSDVFGRGLITTERAEWVERRRAVRAAFSLSRLQGVQAASRDTAEEYVAHWARACAQGETVDVGEEMARLSLTVILRSLFGVEPDPRDVDRVVRAFPVLSDETWTRSFSPAHWVLPRVSRGVPTARNRRFSEARRNLLSVVFKLLKGVPESGYNEPLVDLLHKSTLQQDQIADELVTLLLAGHETTALCLTWAIDLLATHPPVWEWLSAALACGGSVARSALASVVKESLRLYPPAWSIVREASASFDSTSFVFQAGSLIIVPVYQLQRDARYWRHPGVFDPRRFEGGATQIDGSYLPFGLGMRGCVGERTALTEAVEVVSALMSVFKPSSVSSSLEEVRPLVTLRQGRPVRVRLGRSSSS